MSITSDQIRTVGFIHGLADDAADEIEELEKDVAALKEERDELLALRHDDFAVVEGDVGPLELAFALRCDLDDVAGAVRRACGQIAEQG